MFRFSQVALVVLDSAIGKFRQGKKCIFSKLARKSLGRTIYSHVCPGTLPKCPKKCGERMKKPIRENRSKVGRPLTRCFLEWAPDKNPQWGHLALCRSEREDGIALRYQGYSTFSILSGDFFPKNAV
jgi:hypothetical protein